MTKKTPQTTEEFVDYRISEVEEQLKAISDKIDQQNYLSEPAAVKMFVSKAEFIRMGNRVDTLEKDQAKRDKYWFAFASVIIGIVAVAGWKLLTSGVAR